MLALADAEVSAGANCPHPPFWWMPGKAGALADVVEVRIGVLSALGSWIPLFPFSFPFWLCRVPETRVVA